MVDRNLRILMVAAEVAPFAKTGGLADVAGSLPKALAMLGNDVRIVMPRYRDIVQDMDTVADFPVSVGPRRETAILRRAHIEARLNSDTRRVPVYFVDNYQLFDREGIYAHWDDAERYAFFCRAVLEMLPVMDFRPDVIHCNDWQTGPVPFMLKTLYQTQPFYRRISTVFTIHNLRYQGNFPRPVLQLLGAGDEFFRPEELEFYGEVSFMKAGLLYADALNTVSRRYAEEIQTPEYGERMEGILRKRRDDLYGIINGINYHEFDPRNDPRIYANYGPDRVHEKKDNKYGLQRELGLPVKDVPLFGIISRLVDQKGLDLVAQVVPGLVAQGAQLVLLGSGEPHYEELFSRFGREFPEHVRAHIGFNGVLAQKIYAGADMFLMPSRFEPCGLGQLISLRYGTIPIVRETGGLADTIANYEPGTGAGNGFSFRPYTADALMEAIHEALKAYRVPATWRRLVLRAMEADFSWNRSAAEYMDLYDKALGKHVEVPWTA
ncbi:MAG: glycogen synthase GlgA [Bacillota bacterium]